MTFDENLSSKVPIAKIFDELVYDCSDSAVIVSFLKDHANNIIDISENSIYLKSKILQLDFMYKCSTNEVEYLLKFFFDSLKKTAVNFVLDYNKAYAYMCWQICSNYCNLPEYLKAIARKNVLEISTKCNIVYPHHRMTLANDDFACSIEQAMFNATKNDSFADFIADMPLDNFSKIMSFIENSNVFKYRLLAYDVFNCFNLDKLFVFIKQVFVHPCCVYKYTTKERIDVFKMMITSNLDIDIKYCILKTIQETSTANICCSSQHKYFNIMSASQLVLQLMLDSVFDYSDIIYYHLINKHYKILYDLVEIDKYAFDMQIECSDLIEYIKEEQKKTRKSSKLKNARKI